MKNQIRKDLKQQFGMNDIEKSVADSAICESLRGLPSIQQAQTIAAYAAIDHEVDLSPFADWVLAHKLRLCLPRSQQNSAGITEYEMAEINGWGDLQPGSFSIPEPRSECPGCDKNQIDVWLIPGRAFALDGTRLGRGGGFYDRLLQGVGGIKIGVFYNFQLLDSLPHEAHDIAMDMLITEQRVITINKKDC